MTIRPLAACLAASAAVLLAACGGDSGGSVQATGGRLIEPAATVANLPKSALQVPAAPCDVSVVALNYDTPGAKPGETSNSSAGLLVPVGTDPACRGPFPLLAYARGTEVNKPRTMASGTDAETRSLAAVFASQGYLVVATDYLGFAKSAYPFHPYLHADSEASAVIDSIRAARAYAAASSLPLSGRVMLYGYSQGGHSSLATQKAIETDPNVSGEIRLAAAGHGAAPAALSTALRSGAEIVGGQYFIPFLITAWQKVYGDVYSDASQVFRPPYSGYIQDLLPSPTDTFTTLVTTGKLPATNYNAALFQPAFIASLQNGTSGVIRAAERNDLVASGWSPASPTRFCAGSADPVVLYPTAQQLAVNRWGSLPNVSARDVNPQVQAVIAQRNLSASDVAQQYHGQLAPPFCLQDMKAYFDARR